VLVSFTLLVKLSLYISYLCNLTEYILEVRFLCKSPCICPVFIEIINNCGQRSFPVGTRAGNRRIWLWPNVGQKPRCGHAFGNDLRGHRSNLNRRTIVLHTLTVFTRILIPDMADYLNLCRYNIELFGFLLPDPAKRGAAATDLSSSAKSWITSTRGRPSGSGFFLGFLRVCGGMHVVFAAFSSSAAASGQSTSSSLKSLSCLASSGSCRFSVLRPKSSF
jgi:hypothetical protein